MSTFVFRVETEDGTGPYTGRDSAYAIMTANFNIYRHPTPEFDSKLAPQWRTRRIAADWKFGFKDAAQFRAWFYNEDQLQELLYLGYRVVQYEVADNGVMLGNAQVVFDKLKAVKVKEVTCLNQLQSM